MRLAQRGDLVADLHILEQHRELIAPEARQQTLAAGRGPQPLGDVLQHAITEAVPERIVDRFEVVEVDEQQRQRACACRRARAPRRSRDDELAPIGQLGQRVVMRQVVQLPGALVDVPFELGLVGAQLASACSIRSAMALKDSASSSISAEPPRGARAPRSPPASRRVSRP